MRLPQRVAKNAAGSGSSHTYIPVEVRRAAAVAAVAAKLPGFPPFQGAGERNTRRGGMLQRRGGREVGGGSV